MAQERLLNVTHTLRASARAIFLSLLSTLACKYLRKAAMTSSQKYEKGANRISAGRMIQFAEKLGVTPAYFVEGFGGGSKANGDTIKLARAIESVAASGEGVAVLQAMAQMKPARRKLMVTLARALRDME